MTTAADDAATGVAGRTALVNGRSEGIGIALAAAGSRVVVTAQRGDVRKDVEQEGGSAVHSVAGDGMDTGFREDLLRQTVELAGPVDILVNNVGGGQAKPFLQLN